MNLYNFVLPSADLDEKENSHDFACLSTATFTLTILGRAELYSRCFIMTNIYGNLGD